MESAKARETGRRNLKTSRHEHELNWDEGLPEYSCGGCKQFGIKKGYKCTSCADFTLHKGCAESADEICHNNVLFQFRPTTKLHSRSRGILSHSCDACGQFIKGFVFECSSPDLSLHPLCMVPETFNYPQHEDHSLVLVKNTDEYTCDGCKENFSGWRYVCEEEECNFKLDLNCCIVAIHGLSGITKVAPPSQRKEVIDKAKKGTKAVTGGVVSHALTVVGEGLVTVGVGLASSISIPDVVDSVLQT